MKRCVVWTFIVILMLGLVGCNSDNSFESSGLYVLTEVRDKDGNIQEVNTYNDQGVMIQTDFYKSNKPYSYTVFHFNSDGSLNKSVSGGYIGKITSELYKNEYTYDSKGNRTSRTYYNLDEFEKLVKFEYDADGNLVKEAFFDIKFEPHYYAYTYDTSGNLIDKTNYTDQTENSKTVYEYDNNGNLILETTYDQDGTKYSQITYQYDTQNRLIDKSVEGGYENSYKCMYNDDGTLAWEEELFKNSTERVEYTYSYDKTGCTVTLSTGETWRYTKISVSQAQAEETAAINDSLLVTDVKSFYIP